MQMRWLFSFEWVFPRKETTRNYIDKVDDINPEYGRCSCDFATADDGECGYEEREHNRPRISHDNFARDISSREEKSGGDDDGEKGEEKPTIFLPSNRIVCEVEFGRESC